MAAVQVFLVVEDLFHPVLFYFQLVLSIFAIGGCPSSKDQLKLSVQRSTVAFRTFQAGSKLDYICEHMASVGSLDVVNLPIISADTNMSLPMVISPIRTRHSQVGMSCVILELLYMIFFCKAFQITYQQTDNYTSIAALGS